MLMHQNDFVESLTKSVMGINGISGTMRNVSVSSIRWKIHNDEGRVQTILLPNLLHVPNITLRQLKMQH
jgi:hypothetical protein